MCGNGLGYEYLLGLVVHLVCTHQTENPQGFSEVGENKQLNVHGFGISFLQIQLTFRSYHYQLLLRLLYIDFLFR